MKLAILSLLFFNFSCSPPQEEAVRTTASASAYDAPSKWASISQFPLNMKISNQFEDAEIDALNNTVDNWNDTENDFNYLSAQTTELSNKSKLDAYNDNVMGIYKLSTWPNELPPTALAVTQIFGTKKNVGKSNEYIKIEHADILINYDYYTFKTGEDWGYDLETVVLHELGHLLGLYHNDTSSDESVMYPTISRYTLKTFPLEADILNLQDKYSLQAQADSFRVNQAMDAIDEAYDEKVIVIHEIRADGTEKTKIKKYSPRG